MKNRTKDWLEFRETGLFHFVNSFLHMFGWCIIVALDEDQNVISVYPAKTEWRGFSEEDNDEAYERISKLLK